MRRAAAALLVAFLAATAGPVACLRCVPPPTSAFMLQRRIEGFARGRPAPVHYRWVPWREIAPSLPLAVVASEDQRFAEHFGFDVDSIADAIRERERRIRGASTITQQVAKNLFLWPQRSLLRKGLEAYFSVLLECLWTKRRILEVYLNVAEFGEGTYGVDAAAGAFFGKRPRGLSRRESALLAAVLPNPRRLRAAAPSAYLRLRAEWIEAQMARLGGSAYLGGL